MTTAADPPDISQLFASVQSHPLLAHLSFNNLATFLCCAKILKDGILQPQPYNVSIFCAPSILPQSVTAFLAASLDMSLDVVGVLWSFTKDIVWELLSSAEASVDDEDAFRTYSHELGLSKVKKEPHRIVLFTHSEGVKPGWTVHLKCRECNTNYQANYSVKGAFQTYYRGMPQYIQVSDHQFIELQLTMHWMDLMQIAYLHVSATNCTNLYAVAQTCRNLCKNDDRWQFGNALTTEQVWDCFMLLALLDDHQ
ncbi:uncharacterized protein EDB91DRAFT_1054795 [Suillus paluster]|uniref:uncharacterized protein n=1 Tax=Suillus paluster TaxID=48578 RepID=UPI001B871C23|nr:uncharacterized protein EDB91DRAFT_1054795 [Suillus paluster]KAG1738147.1 hypothetical protein EDB91DRAFT_1054795 [Suillus paluster]